jgi:hypothetical protein
MYFDREYILGLVCQRFQNESAEEIREIGEQLRSFAEED